MLRIHGLRALLAVALVLALTAGPVSATERIRVSFDNAVDPSVCGLTVDLAGLTVGSIYSIAVEGVDGDLTTTIKTFSWLPSDDGIRSPKTTTIMDAYWDGWMASAYGNAVWPKVRASLFDGDGNELAVRTINNRCS